MRLVFICGSLAPGRDGVGDYTRRLAHTCAELGHACLLVSLCDVVDEDCEAEGLQFIRRRNSLNASAEEQATLHTAITQWKPDWCSLQFVCFAFHPKGFVHTLSTFLKDLPDTAHRHIMFHELWIRQAPSMPFKLRILGLLQRRQILSVVQRWHPKQCHTSNALYRELLANNNIESKELPLFGNIPIDTTSKQPPVTELIGQRSQSRRERIVIVPFSQLDRWEVRAAMTRLHQLATAADVSLHLVQVGRDRNGEARWAHIAQRCDQWGWQCDQLGPQDATTISQLMQHAHLGMNSTHIQMYQKSGAVRSMLEHGLPVLCAGIKPESRRQLTRSRNAALFSINDSDAALIELLKNPRKRSPASKQITTAKQFISELAL